jgi:hypothetical protein
VEGISGEHTQSRVQNVRAVRGIPEKRGGFRATPRLAGKKKFW